jgi:hypothetical protein
VQSDAEHEKDYAQLGQLADGRNIADKAWSERTDRDARKHIADNRGQADTPNDEAAEKSRH